MTLGASSPSSWAEQHRPSPRHEGSPRLATLADLLVDGAALLRAGFDEEVRAGWPPQAAAIGTVGAYGGMLAAAVGFRLAATAAHWLPSTDAACWWLDDDGWCYDVTFDDVAVLVDPEHPWARSAGVEVVADRATRDRRTIDAIVSTVAPIVGACHGLTRVGRKGLWSTVIDAYGASIVHQRSFPVTSEQVDRIRSGTGVDGVPWRGRPDVVVHRVDFGEICVVRRSGCCLAYLATWPNEEDEDDEAHRAYAAEFPDPVGAPAYCADCSLRSLDDCITRQTWWREYEYQHPE